MITITEENDDIVLPWFIKVSKTTETSWFKPGNGSGTTLASHSGRWPLSTHLALVCSSENFASYIWGDRWTQPVIVH